MSTNGIKKAIFFLCMSFVSMIHANDTVEIKTAQGIVQVTKNPSKIAVLDLGVLENLEALGITAGAVNNNLYSTEKEQQYKDTPRIGTIHQPDPEKLISYEPNLIIVASRSARFVKQLSNIAPTIDMSIKGSDLINESEQRLQELGKIFDKNDEAEKIIADLNKKLDDVKKITKDKGNALFVLTMGSKISTFGKQSRFGWIFSDFGIKEAVENSKQAVHGEPISFEYIQKANPDWLIVFDRATAIGKNADSAQQVLNNPLVANTTAWKQKQVIFVDPSIYLAVGGITGINKTLDTAIEAFSKAK